MKALLTLGALGLICGTALVLVSQVTGDAIVANRALHAQALMRDLLGDDLPDDLQTRAWGACERFRLYRTRSPGYGGPIDVLALWHPPGAEDPARLTLRVEQHLETPGIGDFIDHARDPWITGMDRATHPRWQGFDNISGATVTSHALRRAAAQVHALAETDCGA